MSFQLILVALAVLSGLVAHWYLRFMLLERRKVLTALSDGKWHHVDELATDSFFAWRIQKCLKANLIEERSTTFQTSYGSKEYRLKI